VKMTQWMLMLTAAAGLTAVAAASPASQYDWSPWSPCSRSCGGGVSQRTRACRQGHPGCREGRAREDVICGMQACPSGPGFRTQQCAHYNDVPYQVSLPITAYFIRKFIKKYF